MMDWGDFLRFVQLLGQEIDLFDVNLNLISKVWSGRPRQFRRREGTNKHSLDGGLKTEKWTSPRSSFVPPPVIFVSRHPNLKMPTQCDISSYTQPGSPDTNQSRGYSPNPFSGFLALINRLLTKYAATSSFIFKEASIIFRLTHSFFIQLFIPRQRKSYFCPGLARQ